MPTITHTTHKIVKVTALRYLLFLPLIFFFSSNTYAANLTIKATGQTPDIQYSVLVDKIDKLAGMKLTLTYPKEQLRFIRAERGKKLHSFMHVVNDKVPGKLVVVMASAKGISGENISLFELFFSMVEPKAKQNSELTPTGCDLMSEILEPIQCDTAPQTPAQK